MHEVIGFLHAYGAIVIFVIIFFESTGVPLPGESLLIAAGLLAAQGQLDIVTVFLAAWAGGVLGDNLGYVVGRVVGRPIISRYGQKIGLTEPRFAAVEKQFLRYGAWVVVFARFFVVLRQLNGIVAGITGMHWLRFFLANASGALLWAGFWTLASYYFGAKFEHYLHFGRHTVFVAGAAAAAIALFLLIRHVRQKKTAP
ncbi:DedA family protein [Aureimonas fodinaquatilis]|uniref:DedA family protein n=1 Tax=Aureimonas fodinaquatilis TaxID=2565783 RepID=A0A5B0E1E2_9HYPH|nr:DedA family protein [Aureimonas fodinaquatilis]KAA0972468.1 DedA family protein [Aureimonas fodinaquatilis]